MRYATVTAGGVKVATRENKERKTSTLFLTLNMNVLDQAPDAQNPAPPAKIRVRTFAAHRALRVRRHGQCLANTIRSHCPALAHILSTHAQRRGAYCRHGAASKLSTQCRRWGRLLLAT